MSVLALWGMLDKPAGQLGENELKALASVFKADNKETVESLFAALQAREPETLVRNLLGSETVKSLVQQLRNKSQDVNSTIFCKCPRCATSFETSIA